MILTTVSIALMAVIASVTGLNVAQTHMAVELGASQSTVLWIINIYTLALAALLLPLGALGDPPQAVDSLAAVRDASATPGDDSLRHWRRVDLGRFIAAERYRPSLALTDAGRPEEARVLLTAADAVLGELSGNAAEGVRELAERTAARVRKVD